jgi:hypothetical protein
MGISLKMTFNAWIEIKESLQFISGQAFRKQKKGAS